MSMSGMRDNMIINKEVIKEELTNLLIGIFQLPEVNKVKIREIDIYSAEEKDTIEKGIEDCYHDVLSDVDLGIYVTLNPEEVGNGLGYHNNPGRIGLKRENYLGLAYNESNGGLFQMFRVILRTGIRFDIGVYITQESTAPTYNISMKKQDEIKDEGKYWPRWDLSKADTFWFSQIHALAKLMRGDYLISDHLANMQINETLVAQMIERDDYYGTNFHRYGYHEELDYRCVSNISFKFAFKDDTYNIIANKILSAAVSYDRLISRLNPGYQPRSDIFFEVWKQYEEGMHYRS
ncbi:MAG: hypothetical protein K0S47_3947 [Herbinix sp.]|jgi:hypothetical protein|nr:hypothetical protein [Herbinix sp.]